MAKESLPVRNRSCRDIPCLIVFVLFVFGAFGLMIWAWNNGDIDLVIRDHDVAGNVCGRKVNVAVDGVAQSGQDMSRRPYLFYDVLSSVNLQTVSTNRRITECLSSANTTSMTTTNKALNTTTNNNSTSTNVTTSNEDGKSVFPKNAFQQLHSSICRYCVAQCPEETSGGLWRCLPLSTDQLDPVLKGEQEDLPFLAQIVADIRLSLREILLLALIAFGMSILVTVAFRFLANVVIYVVLATAVLAGVGGALFLWFVWKSKRDYFSEHTAANETSATAIITSTKPRLLRAYAQSEVTAFLVAAIALSIVAALMILLVIVLWRRIALLVQLFKEAARAVHAMPIILLQPLWTVLWLALVVGWWTSTLLLLNSTGSLRYNPTTGFVKVERDTGDGWHFFMMLYHLFALFWFTQFVLASQLFVTASMVVTWYFSSRSVLKHALGTTALISGVRHLLFYHIGSLALGSLLIALVKLLRALISMAEKQTDDFGPIGKLASCLSCCCQCCLGCCESLLKGLNRYAYIEMALFGKGFLGSAKLALTTMGNNGMRMLVINTLGDLVLFLAKFVVVLVTVLVGIEMLEDKAVDQDKQVIHHEWPILVIAAINAYVIADACLSVFEMAVDSLFVCFCEDCRINDGSEERPYCMSDDLKSFLGKNDLKKVNKRQVSPMSNGGELTKVV